MNTLQWISVKFRCNRVPNWRNLQTGSMVGRFCALGMQMVTRANQHLANGQIEMKKQWSFARFYAKNDILALFLDDVSISSSAGPRYRRVTWQLTGR